MLITLYVYQSDQNHSTNYSLCVYLYILPRGLGNLFLVDLQSGGKS